MTEFTDTETDALVKAICYWVEEWDIECPTLFGLEREDLEDVARNWPGSLEYDKNRTLLACLVSLGEILHGASALPRSRITGMIGINYEAASNLCRLVQSKYHDTL